MGTICSAEHATHPTDMGVKNKAYVSTDSKAKQNGLNNPKLDPYIEPGTQYDPISSSGRRSISSTAPICVQVGSGAMKASGQFCTDEDGEFSVSRDSHPNSRSRGTETNHSGTTHNSLYLFGSPDPNSRNSHSRNTATILQQQQQIQSQMRPAQVSTDAQRHHIREMLVHGRRGRNPEDDEQAPEEQKLAPPAAGAVNPNRKSTGIPKSVQKDEPEVPFGARADLAARRRYSVDSYSINMKKQLKNKKISKDDFQFVQVLGRGHFAEVREWVHKATGVHYAVKVIDKSSSESMECIHEELQILMRAGNHPNVVQLIDSFEDSTRFYIVMELCKGGDLFTHIVSEGKYSEARAVECCRQLASALRHIHRNGVTHRDLKPENILLSSRQPDALLKLADFGLSKIINDRSPMKTVCGTWAYCAPEVIAHKPYTRAVDNWTLGVLTFILLSGYHPFDVFGDLPEPQLLEKIAKCEYDFNDPAWVGVGDEPKRLIRGLLQLDPTQRMSLDDFLQSPWIRGSGASTDLYDVPEKLKRLKAQNNFRAVVMAKVHARKIKDFARRSVEKSRRASMGASLEKGGNALFMAAILNAAKARTTAHSEAGDQDAMMCSEPSSPTGYDARDSGRDGASPITATRRLLLQLDRKTPIEPASQPTSPAMFGRSLNVHVPRDDLAAPRNRGHAGW